MKVSNMMGGEEDKNDLVIPTEPSLELPLEESQEILDAVDCEPFTLQERVPSDWDIKANGDGLACLSNTTGKVFIGSRERFKELMRGV